MTGRQSPPSSWPFAAALFAALAVPAVAAAATVTVQADPRDAQVGQPVRVTVRVRGAADTPTVKPPIVAGAEMAQVGQPTSLPTLVAQLEGTGAFRAGGAQHIANALRGLAQMPNMAALDPQLAGLGTNDYFFTYQVTPGRAGALVVPPFTVSADGQTTATPPLTVNVTEARPQPWVQMRLSLSNPAPNVGEEVRLYVDLLIQRGQVVYGNKTYPYLPVSKTWLGLPPLDKVRAVAPDEPLDQFVRQNAIEPGKQGFRINTFPVEVKLEHEPADGRGADLDPARYRRRLSIPLRVRAGGEVTLAAAHAAGEVYVPTGGNKGQWQPFVVASPPLTFTALDLRRRADRPPDFTGAVGEVRVTAQASETEMPAGTPFTLTVRLEGNGSVAAAGAPDLGARPEFANSFRVRLEEERTADKVRQFTYTLRPLSENVTEVPPVPVGYFDPKANKFGTARSEAIPLRVTPAQNVTPDAPQAAAPSDAEPQAGWSFEALVPWVEMAMALALAVCAAAWAARRLRRPPKAAASPAPPLAIPVRRREPAAAPTFATVRQGLQDFLRRHFHLPPGEVTPRDAEECLRRGGVPDGLARSFAALLDTCETAEFAPGVVSTSPSDLAAYARQLTGRILAAIPEVVV